MLNLITNLIYPSRCLSCKRGDKPICINCINEIMQKDLICPICFEMSSGGVTHTECRDDFTLDGLWSYASYQGALKTLLYKFKYRLVFRYSKFLSELIYDYFIQFKPVIYELMEKSRDDWVITSVPIPQSERNLKGFNPSELIARDLAKSLNIKYVELLTKDKSSTFLLKDSKLNLESKKVTIFNDLWSKGVDLKRCAILLKEKNVHAVWALTLAR